jgi:hypothetical protein
MRVVRRQIPIHLLLGVLMGTLVGPAGAQQAAPAPFRPDVIRPYATAWRFTLTRPDGKAVAQGLWSDLVDTMTVDGRAVVRRVQGVVYVNGLTQSMVNVFDARTMLPVSSLGRRPRLSPPVTSRTFLPDGVITRHLDDGGNTVDSVQTRLPGPLYDYSGGTYGILVAALPLRDGYATSFRSIGEFADSVEDVSVQVVGRERAYAGSGRTLDAWKVRQGELTYWIADVPPYVLRLEDERADGGKIVWEIAY